MTDNMMPELTLTPDDTATAAAVEVPSLTLTPEAPEVPKEEEKKIEPVEMDDKLLTEEEKRMLCRIVSDSGWRPSPTRSTSATPTRCCSTAPRHRRAWRPSPRTR